MCLALFVFFFFFFAFSQVLLNWLCGHSLLLSASHVAPEDGLFDPRTRREKTSYSAAKTNEQGRFCGVLPNFFFFNLF